MLTNIPSLRNEKPAPERMRALQFERHDPDLYAAIATLAVVTKPMPRSGRGQVLVKIEAAPCNPSDLLCKDFTASERRCLQCPDGRARKQ